MAKESKVDRERREYQETQARGNLLQEYMAECISWFIEEDGEVGEGKYGGAEYYYYPISNWNMTMEHQDVIVLTSRGYNLDVYATPFYDGQDPLLIQVYHEGEEVFRKEYPLVITGDFKKDFKSYLGFVKDTLMWLRINGQKYKR